MKQFVIQPEQKQIIIGKLLGDGHLETVNGQTYRLKIKHSYRQKDYVDWLYQRLSHLASNQPKIKRQIVRGKMYTKYWFNTSYSSSLKFYGQQFYRNGRKIVPKLIQRWLTPLVLAIWFMDDGSIKSKECQGKILNTQGFDQISLKLLQQALEQRYDITTRLRSQREGYQLYIPAAEVEKVRQLIGKYVLPSMWYKLG